jgi:uncharacterized alpha-E superfamily protein
MLSRMANRVYWLSRYMERAGNTAKIINAYANLFLDLPAGTEIGWHTLVDIHDANELFSARYDSKNEEDVLNFLLFDETNFGSIYSSICFARENARTTRDILPSETWEIVNSLYLAVRKEVGETTSRTRRFQFLREVMSNVMRLEGMLNSGLSRNNTFKFIQLGRNIERADTTTRILHAGSLLLTEGRSNLLIRHEGVVWMNILRSMNAYQMYRQEVKRKVVGKDVFKFLLFDKCFPRSVTFCIDQIMQYASTLHNPMEIIAMVNTIENELYSLNPDDITDLRIRRQMDELQKLLGELHNSIEDAWFNNNLEL